MQTKWEDTQEAKVCAFDIDGVLNYYPDPWVQYINKNMCEFFLNLNEVKRSVPYQIYKDLKYDYRESGVKESLKVRTGAKEVLEELKRRGYTILILTSRPFDEHKTLFKQTTNWLDKNELTYDGVIFGKNKYQDILTRVPNLRFMVDDHRYYANTISKWGYTVFLMDNAYNKGGVSDQVTRIRSLEEVLEYERDFE